MESIDKVCFGPSWIDGDEPLNVSRKNEEPEQAGEEDRKSDQGDPFAEMRRDGDGGVRHSLYLFLAFGFL
jgi:hypothetical protein